MIKQKYYELFEKYYYNGSPQQKARFDLLGMLIGSVLGSLIVIAIASYGLWFELGIFLIVYCMYQMISLLYKSRVEYYKLEEKINKNG